MARVSNQLPSIHPLTSTNHANQCSSNAALSKDSIPFFSKHLGVELGNCTAVGPKAAREYIDEASGFWSRYRHNNDRDEADDTMTSPVQPMTNYRPVQHTLPRRKCLVMAGLVHYRLTSTTLSPPVWNTSTLPAPHTCSTASFSAGRALPHASTETPAGRRRRIVVPRRGDNTTETSDERQLL
jgi:hypothetical protein